jgi:hypothetical protein
MLKSSREGTTTLALRAQIVIQVDIGKFLRLLGLHKRSVLAGMFCR